MNPGKILIFGAAGMVGQALVAEAGKRSLEVVRAARSGGDLQVDITDDAALRSAIARSSPTIVINSAAIVDLAGCEAEPDLAHRVNTRAVGVMAAASEEIGAKFVQISTDHYFTGYGARTHAENAPVALLNEYAKSKFAGEALALGVGGAMVIRTNVTGFRGNPARPTFVEWAIEAILSGEQVRGFGDYFTSTMDTTRFAVALFDLLGKDAAGLINVASREVASKFAFLELLASELGAAPGAVVEGSLPGLLPRRAESLGLDVSKAEAILGYRLPTLAEVVSSLVAEWRAST